MSIHPIEVSRPLISIVTVTFNAVKTLPATFAALNEQRFKEYEWIVVDGASTDGTIEWLKQHRSAIDCFVSEPDKGIFDAMNKAIRRCTGLWVFFLNADDSFVDADVLLDISRQLANVPDKFGLVFGDARYVNDQEQWRREFQWVTPKNLVYGDLCHQVVFARLSLFDQVGEFDSGYRYNADFDWLVRVARAGYSFQHVPREIINFYKGGAHVKAAIECELERYRVRYSHCSPIAWRVGNILLRIRLRILRSLGWCV